MFERYHGPLFKYLYRLTNDRETREDLTQTVFECLLEYHRNSYQYAQPFEAWVDQMVRNVHADHWHRSKKLHTANVKDVERIGGLGGAAFAPNHGFGAALVYSLPIQTDPQCSNHAD